MINELERQTMEQLRAAIKMHRLPPTTLGSGRTTVADKFCCCIHAMWLESGSPKDVQDYCGSFVATTTDMGHEFALGDIADTPIKSILPWVQLPEPEVEFIDCDDLEDVPEDGFPPAERDEFKVGFGTSIAVAGLLHVIHNAGNDLATVCHTLPEVIEQMKSLATLISGPSTNERLRATCFSSAEARPFHLLLQQFSAKVYEARWGSVAWCAQQLLNLEKPLRRYWSMETYMSAGVDDAKIGRSGKQIDVPAVNDAIGNQYFWSALWVVDNILHVIRCAISWAESCRCHWHLLRAPELLPRNLIKQLEACPMKGSSLSRGGCRRSLRPTVKHVRSHCSNCATQPADRCSGPRLDRCPTGNTGARF